MSAIDFGLALYKGRRKLTICGSENVTTGDRGPALVGISEAHKAKVGTTGSNNCAKISHAAVVLEYILTGRLAALEGSAPGRVYVETTQTTGDCSFCTFDGTKTNWTPEVPESSGQLCVPFVMYALRQDSPMLETKECFSLCVSEYLSAGAVNKESLFKFCDALYYEWKNHHSTSFTADNFLSQEVIRQSIRTGTLQPFALFDEISLVTKEIEIAEVPKSETKTATVSVEGKFKNCREGSYMLRHCWDANQHSHIPSLTSLESFVPSKQFFTLVDLIDSELNQVIDRMEDGEYGVNAIKNNYVNAILVGKPGTGKTTLANALAATFGMPVRVVAPNKHSEEDLFTGMTKVSEGGFKFVETPFLDVYKNGGILLMEEFNLGDPAILMGALGQAIEKPFILYEDGYKEVRRHPLCVIISTMNSGTQGSREPSEAFTSRSPDTIILDDPEEEQFLEILSKNGYAMKSCKKVYNVYSKILNYLESKNAKDIAMSITMRHCLAALRRICKLDHPFKESVRDTMVGTIAIKDYDLAKMVYQDIVEPLRD